MKVYFPAVALLLLAVVVKGDYREDLQKIELACRPISHVSEEEMTTFLKGEWKDKPSNALKCHLKCIIEKQGHWNKGGYDSAAALKQLAQMPNMKEREPEVTKLLNDCKDKKGTDECDTAYLITKCIVEHQRVSN